MESLVVDLCGEEEVIDLCEEEDATCEEVIDLCEEDATIQQEIHRRGEDATCEENATIDASLQQELQQEIHRRGAVDTRVILEQAEHIFRDFRKEERPTFAARGNPVCRNNRDAVWFATQEEDGFWPLYRIHNKAYFSPRGSLPQLREAKAPLPMPAWMRGVLDSFAEENRIPRLNHVVMHRYLDGDDDIGSHHDKYMDMQPGSSIISISAGSERRFVMEKDGKRVASFMVKDGDAVILPYRMNKEMKHSIPKMRNAGQRISITARTMDSFFCPDRRLFRHREAVGNVAY